MDVGRRVAERGTREGKNDSGVDSTFNTTTKADPKSLVKSVNYSVVRDQMYLFLTY